MPSRSFLLASSLCLILSQVVIQACDINTRGTFNDRDLIKAKFKSQPQVEIFKIQGLKLYQGYYAPTVFKTFTVLGGMQTTYLLNNGETVTVCHGGLKASRLGLDVVFASDEFLTEIRWRVGNRVDHVIMKTNKRQFNRVGGGGGAGSSSRTRTAPNGKVIQALVGKEIGGEIRRFSDPVYSNKPDEDTVYLVEITEDIVFTPRVNNADALKTDSPNGRVVVDNSDIDAVESQSQTLSFAETFTSSETNTVSETFSASASVSTTVSASVGLKGIFEVGGSTTYTAGFGFERSLEKSNTIQESREISISSPVVASPGTITTGTVFIRKVDYVIDWEAQANVYYLGNPGIAVNMVLTGTLEGEQAIDASLVIEIENLREEVEEEGEEESEEDADADEDEGEVEDADDQDVDDGGSSAIQGDGGSSAVQFEEDSGSSAISLLATGLSAFLSVTWLL